MYKIQIGPSNCVHFCSHLRGLSYCIRYKLDRGSVFTCILGGVHISEVFHNVDNTNGTEKLCSH